MNNPYQLHWTEIWTKKDIDPLPSLWPRGSGKEDLECTNEKLSEIDDFFSLHDHCVWYSFIRNNLPHCMLDFSKIESSVNNKKCPLIEARKAPLPFFADTPLQTITNRDCNRNSIQEDSPCAMHLYCYIWENESETELEYIIGYFIAGKYGIRLMNFRESTLNAIHLDIFLKFSHQLPMGGEIPNDRDPLNPWNSFRAYFTQASRDTEEREMAKAFATSSNDSATKESTKATLENKPTINLDNKEIIPNIIDEVQNKTLSLHILSYNDKKEEKHWNHILFSSNKLLDNISIGETESNLGEFKKSLEKFIGRGFSEKTDHKHESPCKLSNNMINSALKRRKNNQWELIYPKSRTNSSEVNDLISYLHNLQPAYKLIPPKKESISEHFSIDEIFGGYNRPPIIEKHKPIAIWKKKLPFYPNHDLYELIDWRFNSNPRHARFLYSSLQSDNGEKFVELSGTSPPIHTLNTKELSAGTLTFATAADYLHFFCDNVHGEFGPFSIIEEITADICFQAIGYNQRTNLENLLSDITTLPRHSDKAFLPIHLKRDISEDNKCICIAEALVLYSDSLFGAHFKIYQDGLVEMPRDMALLSNLKTESLRRTPTTHFTLSSKNKLGSIQLFRENYDYLAKDEQNRSK